MSNWSSIFNDLDEALKNAKKKFKYRNTTKLNLRVIFNNQKGALFKGTIATIRDVLWSITEEYGTNSISKFAVTSVHGRRVFFCEPSPDLTKVITGDNVTIENFENLSEDTRAVRVKILECQINDRLSEMMKNDIPKRNK